MNTIKNAYEAAVANRNNLDEESVELDLQTEEEEDERDGLALSSQARWTDSVDGYSNPNATDDDSEELQHQESRAGLEGDDEEWNDELTGIRSDNAYLPGQRMAEQGLDHEVFPQE